MKSKYIGPGAALLLACLPVAGRTAEPAKGDIIIDMRLRSESVDQDGFGRDAHGITLRTRLGYETPAFRGFKVLGEAESVIALRDHFNSTTNGKTAYPVITDPEATELNRLQVSWTGDRGEAVVGRQRLIFDNARFIGNSGFRQNEQTLDAAKVTLKPNKDLSLTYVYVDRVHRIFGDDHPQGEWDSDSHLFHGALKTGAGQVSGYGYLLAFDNAPTQSSATWGVRLVGSRPLSAPLAVTYEAEVARQQDYRNSPIDFDLGYVALSLGLKQPTRWAAIGVEQLDGDGRRAFQTPLGTLHAFQGWADVFLTTPSAGLRDLNLPLKLQAVLHDFTDDDGSMRYGREYGLAASLPLNPNVTAELKGAQFEGSRPGFADRRKIWLGLEFKY